LKLRESAVKQKAAILRGSLVEMEAMVAASQGEVSATDVGSSPEGREAVSVSEFL
jgi:hypothetical protein